jgi:hypothetical protein
MKSYWSGMYSSVRLYSSKWLSLVLITLLSTPALALPNLMRAGFVRTFGAGSTSTNAPQVGIGYGVNSTGDGDNVGSSNFCDDGTGNCTLRAALQAANLHPGADFIGFVIPASDSGCDANANCTINLPRALPDVSDSVTISGPGPDKLTVRRDTGSYRIFNVTATGTVTISGLTISNGLESRDAGGGVENSGTGTVHITNSLISGNRADVDGGIGNRTTGTVNVTNSTISGNEAVFGGGIGNGSIGTVNVTNSTISGNSGGGIFNRTGTVSITNTAISGNEAHDGGGIHNFGTGTVNITNTRVSGNSGQFSGGGISNSDTGIVNVTNSTISDNSARLGGGIDNNSSGTVNVTNSTISGNRVTRGRAGGIGNFGTGIVNLTNSTLSGNRAFESDGGGIGNFSTGTMKVTNTTVSGNEATAGGGIFDNSMGLVSVKSCIIGLNTAFQGPDVFGSFNTQGFNLVGKIDGAAGFNAITDQKGTIASPLDPKLNPAGLQDNGGPTQTIALLCGSPANDKGSSAGLTGSLATDQRGAGFPRTVDDPAIADATGGDATDIGAFELQQICSEPSPIIVAAGSTLVNESCPPANGAVDPGERVTVYLHLTNNGNASTSNLVATLQSSGGVVAPSGPQSYGAIAPGATAGRDFSLTADPALICGGTLTATLQLQDGTTNFGTVTYNFTLGVNNGGGFVCTTPCGGVRLVVRSSLSRTSSMTVQANITVENIGTLPADNTMLTTAKLGSNSGTPLPQALGNIEPGASSSVVVNFSNSMGGASTLTVGGTFSGGTFSSSRRVTVP